MLFIFFMAYWGRKHGSDPEPEPDQEVHSEDLTGQDFSTIKCDICKTRVAFVMNFGGKALCIDCVYELERKLGLRE